MTKKVSSAKSATTKSSGRYVPVGAGAQAISVIGKSLPPAGEKAGAPSVKGKGAAAAKASVTPMSKAAPAPLKALAGSALNVSVKIDPLVDIVRQHVHNISPAAVRAIRNEFVKAFQVTTPLRAEPAYTSKRAAAAEAADPVLSSQEAADLVGVSRPYMVARIDAGDVELHQQVGNQRRVLRSSVLAWQKKEQARQRRALSQLGASLDDEIFSG
jgi:excisionase family DNA binding protein